MGNEKIHRNKLILFESAKTNSEMMANHFDIITILIFDVKIIESGTRKKKEGGGGEL